MKTVASVLFCWVFILTLGACQNTDSQRYVLSPEQFEKAINNSSTAFVLDVRTPGEYADGSILKAINLNSNDRAFGASVEKLSKDQPWFVYCLSGARSAEAAKYMRTHGFKEVYELSGGLLAWQRSKLPLVLPNARKKDQYTIEDYNSLISSGTVLVDFYAPWCGPCKKMEPMLDELVIAYKGKLRLIRINVDENKTLANSLGIVEIPVLQIFDQGKPIWKNQGLVQKDVLVTQLDSIVKK